MGSVSKGDKDAFGILVRRHVDSLYRYALRLTGSSDNAEDLVQETWLAVWQNANRYRPNKASLSTWMHRILHNKFIDGRRRRREEPSHTPADTADTQQHSPWQSATPNEPDLMPRLNRLLSALPENQRAALTLAHIQGFSNKEIAHILGVSLRAAESILARARRTLREQLTDELEN